MEVDIAGAFLAFVWGAEGPRTWTGTAIGGLDPATAVELETGGGGRPTLSTGVLECATGVCTSDGIDLGNVQAADFAPDSQRLVVETFEPSGDELRLWITTPGGTPRVLTTDGGGPSWDPTGEGIAFDRSPYRLHRPGTASVVVIDADGSNERTLVTTNRSVVGWPVGRPTAAGSPSACESRSVSPVVASAAAAPRGGR